MNKQYFHVCANGADARNFIICQADYYAAFNLIAVCAANTQVVVVSFSIEDSHPHFLLWGTGCLVFRKGFYVPVWLFDAEGNICKPVPFGSLGARERRALLHTREWTIPDNWLVCNGLILPTNYVDIARFESIYGSHNRFRVFLSSPKQREEMMLARMAEHRGVDFEDQEARILCGDTCKQMFGTRDPRRLDGPGRIRLAQQLRRQYKLTFRQLATLVRLPEAEVRAHVR